MINLLVVNGGLIATIMDYQGKENELYFNKYINNDITPPNIHMTSEKREDGERISRCHVYLSNEEAKRLISFLQEKILEQEKENNNVI